MAPKKRVKKGKSALTRGRTAKQQNDEEVAVTTTATSQSETEDDVSEREHQNSSNENVKIKSSPKMPPNRTSGESSHAHDNKKEEEPCWEGLPDLTEELRAKGNNSTITYVTSFTEHREFELDGKTVHDVLNVLRDVNLYNI